MARRSAWTAVALGLAVLVGLAIGCADDGAAPLAPSGETKGDPQPAPSAFLRSGPQEDGSYLLPNVRRITPAGRSQWTYRFPNDVKVTPDGERAVVTTFFDPSIALIDTATMDVAQTIFPESTFTGIVFNAAGDRFWVGGGLGHTVQEYAYAGGAATPVRTIRVWGYPAGLALSPDEQTLYVAANMENRVAEIDLASGTELRSAPTHIYPYDVKLLPDGGKLYVSNWGSASVTVIDTASMTAIADVPTGKNPTKLAMSADGARVYSADSDTDTVTAIDTATDAAVATWPLHDDAVDGEVKIGSYPNAIDLSADGTRLYVASAGFYCVTVMDAQTGEVLGRIPTGWYTSGVDVDDAGGTLWVVNGKGYGSASAMPRGWSGTVAAIDLPTARELADYTEQVDQNISWGLSFFDTADPDFESPIPTEFGTPSEQIKHVIFIMKENKTYDQVLGDLEGTERDPAHLVFGEEYSPNHHRLARAFTVQDNLYVEGDTSILGHFWSTAIQCNEYAEKVFFAGGRYPLSTLEPAAIPYQGKYLWNNLIDHGIDFRIYGQIVGVTHDLPTLMPHMDLKYGFWNMGTLDVDKVDEIIREIDYGIYPPLIYISLPNDHTYGSDAGKPSPFFLVGDNDAGLGKFVEYISRSEHWADTAIFVTEDDPQSGSDHIDKHRTIGLVISPWAKRGHVSSVMHTMMSMWLTIDLILGIPPTTKFDQYTAPMYDSFTMTPDFSPYEAVPNPTPFTINPAGLPYAEYSKRQNFGVPDQVGGMGKVLWAMARPGERFPYELSVDMPDPAMDEDEGDDVREYLEAIARIKTYARAHGLELPSETPFWQDPNILARLAKHNAAIKAGIPGGY
jgi:YVTN family beta-propeller protein